MLRCSSEVVFVDPYFNPQKLRFRRTLGWFLFAILKDRPGAPPVRIELCVDQEKYGRSFFEEECRRKLPAVIPSGMSVRIVRLKQRLGGEELHNRYILTDIGGVSFGHGLDESDLIEQPDPLATRRVDAATDDVQRFGEAAYRQRWRQFCGETLSFDSEEQPLDIVGTATVS